MARGNFLKINDTVQFTLLDNNLSKINDDFRNGSLLNQSNPAQGLKVKIAATHSGIVTRNNGFYLPDKMRTGANSFVSDYPKPVLLHHNEHGENVGRVVEAAYVDTSSLVLMDKWLGKPIRNKRGKEIGTITEGLIKDFVSDRMPFGQKVDVVTRLFQDSLLADSSYEGLGHIQITANITDPAAIQKLLDGRYLTGSVGATTDQAVCSVCKSDWTDTGPCDHKPGGIYDDAKCFIIAGNLKYDEYSFVNVPADRHSKVLTLHYNGVQDQVETVNDSGKIHEVQLSFPQFKEEQMPVADEKKDEKKDEVKVTDSVVTPEEPKVETEEAKKEEPVVDETKKDAAAETPAEPTVDDYITRVLDLTSTTKLSDEEKDKLYDALWAEVEAAVKEGVLTLADLKTEKVEDAKLSTAKRKKLSASTFCGPERSFPVPDCAHVVAARRLVGKYKGPGDKTAILACVSRKAKAMGCDNKATDAAQTTNIKDTNNATRVMRSVLNLLEDDTIFNGGNPVLDEEELGMLRNILKRLATMAGKDSFLNAMVADESLGLPIQTDQALIDEVTRLETEMGELRDRLEAVQKEYNLIYQDMETVNDSLVNEKVKTRKAQENYLSTLVNLRDKKIESRDWSKLDDAALVLEVDRVVKDVDMNKIADKLGDGLSRNPQGEVTPPAGTQTNQRAHKITESSLKQIEAQYLSILFSRGEIAAQNYLLDMRKQGYLPNEESKVGGNS